MGTTSQNLVSAWGFMTKHVMILGATSAMAEALAILYAKQGAQLTLVGRNVEALNAISQNLTHRFSIMCDVITADLSHMEAVEVSRVPDIFIMAAGTMQGDAAQLMQVNYSAPVAWMERLAPKMAEKENKTTIAIIGSVAGDRGRQSNYLYGSAKAALHSYASGLRNRFANTGLHVITIKPGFVDSPMTYGMDSPLIASREKAAATIEKAIRKRKNVAYVPCFWQLIMAVICLIPEPIFKKLKL